MRSAPLCIALGALVLSLTACQDTAEPPPPAPLPLAEGPGEDEVEGQAPPPPPEPLSAEEQAFWFGPAGAPPPLGPPGPPPAPPPAPEEGGGEDAPYLLGPGDLLEFRLPEEPAHDREVTVGPDGSIALDLVGLIEVAGRSVAEVTAELREGYARFFRQASPVLAIKAARPAEPEGTVVVVGPVSTKGRITLAGQETLLDVLAEAGYGSDPQQLSDTITILRAGRSLSLPARELLAPRDPRWNLKLLPDDLVVVHLPQMITVAGEVAKPGSLALPPAGRVGVAHALALAGGLTTESDPQGATILRADGSSEPVDLNAVIFGDEPAPPPLLPGDALSVPAGKPTRVFVFGMVENPGLQRFSGRVSLLEALSVASPKQFGPVTDEAKLVRGWPEHPQVVTIDVDALLYEGQVQYDRELLDGDVVYIPETALSNVLDVLARTLGPISGAAAAAGNFLGVRESVRRN